MNKVWYGWIDFIITPAFGISYTKFLPQAITFELFIWAQLNQTWTKFIYQYSSLCQILNKGSESWTLWKLAGSALLFT